MIKHLSSVRHKKSSIIKKFAEEEIQLSAISQLNWKQIISQKNIYKYLY